MAQATRQGRGTFIGLRKDQLGARLLMMLNAIRLAEDYQSDFRINWFPRGAMAPKLDKPADLFEDEFIAQHFIADDAFRALSPEPKPLWAFLRDKSPDRLEAHLASGQHVLLDEGFEIVAFPWEDGEALKARYRGFITRIGFNRRLTRLMDEIDTAMQGEGGAGHVIAYHIRRGDILNEDPWKHKEWPAKIEPDELYSAYLQKNPGAGALVFSDQPESIARFTAAHPQVKSIDDLVDLSACKPVQRDFLELYAMSRATEIVAPPISAFSRAAARLSGRERNCFHEVMTLDERNAAYEKLLQRFEQGPGAFITPSEAAQIYAKMGRRLQETDRDAQAWQIGQEILDAGADNAFLPLMQAITGIYLHKWDEALRLVETALAHPDQWQENYVTGLAVQAHILGALGKRFRARRAFLRAFWQKPMLPDVMVLGTFMIKRGRMQLDAILPFDRETLLLLPVPYMQHNISVQQNKILRRRALDLSTIMVEWPYFAMDGKARRLLGSRHDLSALRDRLAEHHGGIPGPGPWGFAALIELRLGRPVEAMRMIDDALEVAPEAPLLYKRRAEIHLAEGDYAAALSDVEHCRKHGPDHAFWHFLTGQIHEAAGDPVAARQAYEAASAMDNSTAELHAHLAEVCRKAGDSEAAARAYEIAAEIAPNQQRYRNRAKRLGPKAG